MLVLGIILLVIGYLTGISIVATIGWILIILGAILMLFSLFGHPVGGRTWY